MSGLEEWIKEHRIEEVECLVPDMSGVARGKILPAEKFLKTRSDLGLRLPEELFVQTVTGDWASDALARESNSDIYLVPDPATMRVVPWYPDPTAQVINDCVYSDGLQVSLAPRTVLKRVIKLYHDQGWYPVIAPELEFYLVKVNTDPDQPLEPPIGRSGRAEVGRQAFGIDAVNEFDPFTEDVYDYCEKQRIDIDTLHHEAGSAQLEINFNHSDPLSLADQVFLFKRTVRQAAFKHNMYATFMAKPMDREPGSAMHIHQSVEDADGVNLFADADGNNTSLFLHHISGLQRYMAGSILLFAPNVNSYRRLVRFSDAPINMHWGIDNRTVGLRVPLSGRASRRVENRVAGADCNPYLAIAGSLACGYLGMMEEREPSRPVTGTGYEKEHQLARHLPDAIWRFRSDEMTPMVEILGREFVGAMLAIKEAEWDAYQSVVSSWEREFLLLNV